MSSAIVVVRCGGLLWLKPVVMWFVMRWSAVVVECFVLKPCWWLAVVMCCVMSGRSIFSSSLAMGDSSDIGLYDVLSFGTLLGLGMGMILAVFHIAGMMLLLIDMLNMVVIY